MNFFHSSFFVKSKPKSRLFLSHERANMMSSSGGDSPTPTGSFLFFLSHSWTSGVCNFMEPSSFLKKYAAWELNALLWVFLIGITTILSQKLFKLVNLWIQARKIPGPPCPSFCGHSGLISGQSLIEFLAVSHKKYGLVVKLWLGPAKLLVSITDPEIIEDMLLKAEDKLTLTGKAFRLAFGQSSLFASSFDKVEKRRESLKNELDGRLVEKETIVPTKAMDCIMENINQISCKGSTDCKIVSQHMAFNLLGSTLFGDAFLAWSKAALYEELLMTIAKDACFWASYKVTPFWKQGFWRYQHLCTKLKSLTQDIVQQYSKNYRMFCCVNPSNSNHTSNARMECESDAAVRDNLSIQGLNEHLNASKEPCGNITGLMFHGCQTMAGLICNVLAMLVEHPKIQDKIHSEIIMAQKGSLKEDKQNVDRMPLLLATIYESARFLASAPLLQRALLEHDLRLKSGVIVPAASLLVVPVRLLHMDESLWGDDAGDFNPYRFLSKAGSFSDSGSALDGAEEHLDHRESSYILNLSDKSATFLPFGSGTRSCVGEKYVIQAVATLFASLLGQYEVRLGPGSENSSTIMKSGSISQKPRSPDVVFLRRNT